MRGVLAAFLLLIPGGLFAQGHSQPCSYDACALRLTGGGWFSQPKVVRGTSGVPVAAADRSDDLRELLASSDSAATFYARFETSDRHADRFGLLGGALLVAGAVAYLVDGSRDSTWPVVFYAGGLTIAIAASGPRRRAVSELSTAMWWYNRDLELRSGERGKPTPP